MHLPRICVVWAEVQKTEISGEPYGSEGFDVLLYVYGHYERSYLGSRMLSIDNKLTNYKRYTSDQNYFKRPACRLRMACS